MFLKNCANVATRLMGISRVHSSAIVPSSLQVRKNIQTEVENQISQGTAGRLFAVVHIKGSQYKVTEGDIIVLGKYHLEADIGEKIRLNKILLIGSSDFSLVGRPVLKENMAKVEATVIEKTLGHEKIFFNYIRRKSHNRMRIRQEAMTHLRINSIELNSLE
ncbi:DgyrCDS7840 [Dimorphilus gyrociliatus]|uniref:Large ribosomal subunit protein bL21m n=1 Tax=Dimorphilus gyrociliatus TaxID=2664684 RepID=A0A7I8VTB9_9ANNE|nr:DgyrCDS7840 [Dimorphilus gyrociliatus]